MIDELTNIGRNPDERRRLAGKWGLAGFDFHDEVDSTQNFLRAMADVGAPAWTLAVADHQTEGRGQGGRRWEGSEGASLMFSLLLRMGAIAGAALVPIRTGLAIARTLDRFLIGEQRTMLKWPNDLVVAGGKIGGILCEAQMRGDEGVVIVGVGVNVRTFPLHLDERRDLPAAFLGAYLRPGTTRLDLLESIIRELRTAVRMTGEELTVAEMREYTDRDWLRGRTLAAPVAGVANGITLNGQLKVKQPDGGMTTVVSGRVGLGEG